MCAPSMMGEASTLRGIVPNALPLARTKPSRRSATVRLTSFETGGCPVRSSVIFTSIRTLASWPGRGGGSLSRRASGFSAVGCGFGDALGAGSWASSVLAASATESTASIGLVLMGILSCLCSGLGLRERFDLHRLDPEGRDAPRRRLHRRDGQRRHFDRLYLAGIGLHVFADEQPRRGRPARRPPRRSDGEPRNRWRW